MQAPVCTSCSSDRTQTVKMMCMSATTIRQTAGVGITTSGAVGVGVSKGASVSDLAARFIPGQQPSSFSMIAWGGVIALIGFFLWAQTKVLSILSLLVALILVFAGNGNRIANRRQWSRRVALYESGWICLQCGHAWIPKTS